MSDRYCVSSPLGFLEIIIEGNYLAGLSFSKKFINKKPKSSFVLKTEQQLAEYFIGQRQRFDLPLKLEGTEFQKIVWRALLTIPFGQTLSYGELAKRINKPKAARAVGGACNKNKIAIVIPCHRVIGKDGSLVGFASGLRHKKMLLKNETRIN